MCDNCRNSILSVIVPIYNAEMYIEACLDSLINQDFEKNDYEIICINDGSIDGSLKILERYSEKYSFIKVYNKENGGVSSARNYGVEKAIGEFIIFVDSDDCVAANSLKIMRDAAVRYNASIVSAGYKSVKEEIIIPKKINDMEFIPKKISALNAPNQSCNIVIKKEVIEKEDIKVPEGITMGEDKIFNFFLFLALENEQMLISKERNYYYRIVATSATQNFNNLKDYLNKRYQNLIKQIQVCQATYNLKKDLYCRKKKRIIKKKIDRLTAGVVTLIIKNDVFDAKKELINLKQMGIYPYGFFTCMEKYDKWNNVYTYKNYNLKLWIKNISINIIKGMLSFQWFYLFVFKLRLLLNKFIKRKSV